MYIIGVRYAGNNIVCYIGALRVAEIAHTNIHLHTYTPYTLFLIIRENAYIEYPLILAHREYCDILSHKFSQD